MDCPGCNRSFPSLTTVDNTVSHNLDDLYKIINHFRKPNQKLILAGFSYGTQLSILFAKKYPDLVDQVILVGLWLGDEQAIKHLYQDTLGLYPEVATKLFKQQKIDILESHENIKKMNGWSEGLTWEIFCGELDKKKLGKEILEGSYVLDFSPALYSISFFESFYFSQKDYVINSISYDDLASIREKITIIQGKEYFVCPKLNEEILKLNNIKYKVLSKMGHMPYNSCNIDCYESLRMNSVNYRLLKIKRLLLRISHLKMVFAFCWEKFNKIKSKFIG